MAGFVISRYVADNFNPYIFIYLNGYPEVQWNRPWNMQQEENGEKQRRRTKHYTNRPYFYTGFYDKKFVILAVYPM